MADNDSTVDSNVEEGEEEEPTYRFHANPAIESIMCTISDKAEYYRLANGVLTGKFDKTYAGWKTEQSIIPSEVGELPSLDSIMEWMFVDANLSELLSFKDSVDKLATELNLAIFSFYAKKNVRGTIHSKVEDLKGLREDLTNVLNGTLNMCKDVPGLNYITAEVLESIPAVGERKPFGDGMVWDLPDAPSPEKNEVKLSNIAGQNLRSHNSTVKFVVDGKLPEEDSKLTLGPLCKKYFGSDVVKDIGKLFGGWAKEYFAEGAETPEKAVERNGYRYWLTAVGK